MDLGDSYMGNRVRYHGDGTFTILRLRDTTFIDKHFTRVPGKQRWFIRHHNAWTDIGLEGETANIIGKGPSLDSLRSWQFAKGPIFAINEAIHVVEKLDVKDTYCVQQDTGLRAKCLPKYATLIASNMAATHYRDYEKLYVYNPAEIGLNYHTPTVICIITMLLECGFTNFQFWGFDAAVNQNCMYAKSIGYHPGAGGLNPGRFVAHKKAIEDLLEGCEHKFNMPS
jgi:hypothetical protein